jgi:PIN domain nuclease of toxin-antitoxin system
MVVLDAWAVLALLNDEPAATEVDRAITADTAVISLINLGEVIYRAIPRRGEQRTLEAVGTVGRRIQVEAVDDNLVIAAARLKAANRLSYADAFCVATAQRHDALLYTGDPEILALNHLVQSVDLRSPPMP